MIKEGLLYAKTHEWIENKGDFYLVGISDYAQDTLGAVVFVDLPSAGEVFNKDDVFGAVESVKAASDLYAPAKIEVLEVNQVLEDAPELLNDAPYDTWLLKVKVLDDKGLDTLLDATSYKDSYQ